MHSDGAGSLAHRPRWTTAKGLGKILKERHRLDIGLSSNDISVFDRRRLKNPRFGDSFQNWSIWRVNIFQENIPYWPDAASNVSMVTRFWHHMACLELRGFPDSKGHGTNMGPTWVLSAPDGPHVGPMKPAIGITVLSRSWDYRIMGLSRDSILIRCLLCDTVAIWEQWGFI